MKTRGKRVRPITKRSKARLSTTSRGATSQYRDLTISGRHSKQFYSFATRWTVNDVNLHKMVQREPKNIRRIAKAFVNAHLGRVALTSVQNEKTPGGRG